MMSKKSPQLRFEGFTDDWEERKLEKVFDTITDYVANGSFESLRKNVNSSDINGFAYLVRLQDASNNWQGPWLYTDQHGYEFLKKSRLQPDDIIMANVGSVGKFFLVPKLDKPMTLAPNAVLIKSSENDQGFLYQMMLTPEMQYKIFEKTTPGVQSKINKTDFKMIETRLPNMDEQKKIGAFFKQLDDTISLHQRKLDLLKEQKKGYLQKMFPKNGEKVPELRFAGFADDWEERKLEDVYNILSGFAFKMNDYTSDGVNIINGESINHGCVKSNNWNYLPNSFLEKYSNCILRTGDIVIGLNRPITNNELKIAQIPSYLNNSLLYQRAGKVEFLKNIDVNFTFQILNNEIYKFVLKESQGSDQPFISTTKLKKWSFLIPKNELEQQKIGSFFKQLDDTIALHQRKLDLLKEQKKGFLQKMFV